MSHPSYLHVNQQFIRDNNYISVVTTVTLLTCDSGECKTILMSQHNSMTINSLPLVVTL